MTIAPQQAKDRRGEFRAEFPWCFCCQLLFRDMSLKRYLQRAVILSVFVSMSIPKASGSGRGTKKFGVSFTTADAQAEAAFSVC